MVKRLFYIIFTFTLNVFVLDIHGQSLANYSSVRNTGQPYTSINLTGSAFASWRNVTSLTQDDNRSDFTDIGFDFWYNGVRYTQFSVSTNGFLDFSSSLDDGGPVANAFGYQNTSFTSNNVSLATNPAIAPFYDDLTAQGGVSALGNSIKYELSGSAPSRTLTIEWINMAVYGNTSPSLNFQVKLVENVGKIFINYGTMNSGTFTFSYSMGLNGQTISATPTAAQLKELQTVNSNTFSNAIQNNLSVMPAANSQYVFTPQVPTPVSGALTFNAIGQTGMTVNWPNWASNEVGYVIYNSTDNVNFDFVSQTAVNATSSVITGLSPGTTYYWKLYAVTEGCLSAALTGTQSTSPGGNKISVASTAWGTATTWSPTGVPTISDNVTIANGHTVTINTNAVCNNLTIGQGTSGALLIGNNNTSRSVVVDGNIQVNAGAGFMSNSASNATHNLTLPGNIINNSILNFASDANSLCDVTFSKNGNQTISGTGTTTTFNFITLSMGNSINNVLDIQTQGFVAPADFLILNSGTFKLSTSGASVLTPYSVSSTIPLKGGIWLNSASSRINTGGSLTMYGNITLSNGTFNVGNAADEDLLSNGGLLTTNGGTLNIAGKYYSIGINNLSKFTITGGIVIVPSIRTTNTTIAPFQIAGAGSQFNMSGGSLIIPNEGGSGAQNLGFTNTGSSFGSVTGGTLQIGNPSSLAAQIIQINSSFPIGNLLLSSPNITASLTTNSLSVINDVTMTTGTLSTGSQTISVGRNWSNNGGTFVPGSGNVLFSGTSAQTIFKSGGETFNNITFSNAGNKTLLSPITASTLTINSGSLISNNFSITLTGNWINNGGAFVPGTATTFFTGTAAQTIFKSGGETFNNITFSNAGNKTLLSAISANTLTINSGSLTAGGFNISLTGNWNNNGGTFVPGTGTVLFTGTSAQTIFKTGGEGFYNITFSNAGNKSLLSSISGKTLTINAGSLTANSNSVTLTGDWVNNGGTFVGGTGTVLFTAATAQTIFKAAGETFNNITFSNTGIKSLLSAISGNTLTINTTTLVANNNNVTLTGDWANNTGLFTPGTNTVFFTGTSGQTIFKSGGEIFNNITFSNAGNKTLLSAISANTVTINAGTLTAGSNNITLTGDWTNNGGTFAGGTATVFFPGAAQQNIFKATGETFNNITLSNTGNKTLLSAISGKTLTINATTLTANSNSITLTGNWANNAGTFIPGTGTTLFTGTTAQTILKTGGETFYDITFSNAGNKTLLSPVTGNTLIINSGILTSGSFSISLTGDWRNNGGTFVPGTGTTYFNGTTAQTIFKSGGEIFNNLDFSNAGTKTLLSAITASNVVINAGSALDVNTTNNQITIKGNLINDGSLNTQRGLILLNGTVAQNIGGTSITSFHNLTLNNNAGAGLSNAENLKSTLTISNGTFNTNGKVFTMLSTASLTARIAAITGTGDIVGNVTAQRYAPGGSTGWALLGTPVSSSLTFADWNDDFAISCPSCPNGSNGGFTSIYSYNEAATGSYSATSAYIPISAITNPILPNRGYWVYLGNGQTSTTPIIIDVTGAVRKFNNSIPLTRTNTGSPGDDGWNLIHNPYPSPIKWSSLRNGNASVDNAIYGYNTDLNGGAGGTVAFVNGISSPAYGSGGISDTIPMSQGFQVHCTASTTLTAIESIKVGGNATFVKTNQSSQVTSSPALLRLNLYGSPAYHDETVLYMQTGATNGFDTEYDAIKMVGQDPSAPSIMLQNGVQDFQVNGVSPITSAFTMPLKTTTGYAGTYTISASNISSFPAGACISLYDTYNGTTTNLRTSSYTFTLNSSTINPRFILNITINPLDITTNLSQPTCAQPNTGEIIAIGSNTGPWNYLWKDINGVTLKTSLNKSTADTLVNLSGGDYSLEINTVGQCDNRDSTFTVDLIENVSAQFTSVDTTYLSNSGLVMFTNTSTNAVNNSWDFGDSSGTSISSDPTYNYVSAGIYTVTLIASSNSGCMDTTYKSIVVVSDMTVTNLLSQGFAASLRLRTLEQNVFLLSGVLEGNEVLNFRLVDGFGKLVRDYGDLKSGNINLPINLENYRAGIYYLNITGEKTNKTIKLPVK